MSGADRVVKRSLTVAGHRTSVSLEDVFWMELKGAAVAEDRSLASLVAAIDATRGAANLSSALRLYVVRRLQRRAQ